MENSIEEDITRIKQRIEDVKEYIEYGLSYSEYLDLENSFDNILSDYKRVLKENESLQKTYDDCYCKYKHYKQFESISIQKVKDKIRKNEEIIDISNDGDLIHELLQKNKVYEELLESEE